MRFLKEEICPTGCPTGGGGGDDTVLYCDFMLNLIYFIKDLNWKFSKKIVDQKNNRKSPFSTIYNFICIFMLLFVFYLIKM